RRRLPGDEPLAARLEPWQVRPVAAVRHLERDRVRRPPALPVEDARGEQRRAAGEELAGRQRLDAEPANRLLRQDARDDDESEEHRHEQVQEIVAGVDRGEAEGQGGAETPPAVARGPQRAARPRERPGDAASHLGTGTCWLIERMTASASAPRSPGAPVRLLRRTRWASAETARPFTSSGTR